MTLRGQSAERILYILMGLYLWKSLGLLLGLKTWFYLRINFHLLLKKIRLPQFFFLRNNVEFLGGRRWSRIDSSHQIIQLSFSLLRKSTLSVSRLHVNAALCWESIHIFSIFSFQLHLRWIVTVDHILLFGFHLMEVFFEGGRTKTWIRPWSRTDQVIRRLHLPF